MATPQDVFAFFSIFTLFSLAKIYTTVKSSLFFYDTERGGINK